MKEITHMHLAKRILSCNTGEGHNSCAKAIQETYAAHDETCDIVDALQFISKRETGVRTKSWTMPIGRVFVYTPAD